MKKIDESRNYLLEEIRHNDLINEKHKIRVWITLNILISAANGCVSIFTFASLVGISINTKCDRY